MGFKGFKGLKGFKGFFRISGSLNQGLENLKGLQP